MNTYEIVEVQSNITHKETSSSSDVDSPTQGYFPTKRKQQGRDSAIEQMVNIMKENSYLRQRRHEKRRQSGTWMRQIYFFSVWPVWPK
jgi:hypothetical protein